MILLNFSHPFTPAQREQIEALAGQAVARIIDVPTHMGNGEPFAPQIVALADAAGLTPEEWQTAPLLVNPPGYAPAAVALLAELHGRMGYFPTLVCIRRVKSGVPPRYEVVELLDLQTVRDRARLRRAQSSRQQRQVGAKPYTDEKGHDA